MWQVEQLEFLLKGADSMNSANSVNLIILWSMNWSQFKDPVPHTCLADAVVGSWCLTKEVAGLSSYNENYFCLWIRWIPWKHAGKKLHQSVSKVNCTCKAQFFNRWHITKFVYFKMPSITKSCNACEWQEVSIPYEFHLFWRRISYQWFFAYSWQSLFYKLQ